MKTRPEIQQDTDELRGLLRNLAFALRMSGRPAEAAGPLEEAVGLYSRGDGKHSVDTYNAACQIALCAAATKGADRLGLADRAMKALTLAIESGYRDVRWIAHDAELEILRGRPDFNRLFGGDVGFYRVDYPFAGGPPREPGVIEGESLVAGAKVSAGEVVVQDMLGFGWGWSGGKQLLWRGVPTDGATTVPIEVPDSGSYDITAAFTKANDYGIFTVEVDGKPLGGRIDFYDTKVTPFGPVALGRAELAAGRHEVTFRVVGKAPASTGTLLGLDWIKLTPGTGAR